MLVEPFYFAFQGSQELKLTKKACLTELLPIWFLHCSFEQNSHILKSRFSCIYPKEGGQSKSFINPAILWSKTQRSSDTLPFTHPMLGQQV